MKKKVNRFNLHGIFAVIILVGVVAAFIGFRAFSSTGNIIETSQAEKTTSYIYGNGLVASVDSDGEEKFYINDHLGGTSVVVDENGNKISEESYYAFGEERAGGDSRFTYTGKEKDASGLYYYGARYYDADSGRFTTPDPISGGLGNPQSLNKYVYVLNNPNKYTDPSGMSGYAVGGVEPLGELRGNDEIWYNKFEGTSQCFPGHCYPDPVDVIRGNYGQEYAEAINHLQETAKTVGVDPISVTAAFFKEGFNVQVGGEQTTRIYMAWPVGMEAFGGGEKSLKAKGYLSRDYSGFERSGDEYVNEAGNSFQRGYFVTMTDQVVAFAALYKDYQNQFFEDVSALGYNPSSFSTNVVETWAYRYYITGREDQYNDDGSLKRTGSLTDLRNALQEGGVEGLIQQNPARKSRAWSGQRAAATANRIRAESN